MTWTAHKKNPTNVAGFQTKPTPNLLYQVKSFV